MEEREDDGVVGNAGLVDPLPRAHDGRVERDGIVYGVGVEQRPGFLPAMGLESVWGGGVGGE